jgi:predicted RNA methylase
VTDFVFRSESDDPAPTQLGEVDDRLTADEALKRVRRGEALWYRGTFLNARQLLSAMARRLPDPKPAPTALETFRQERRSRLLRHEVLSKLLVSFDPEYRLELKGAPDLAAGARLLWGPPPSSRTVTSLSTVLGLIGAEAWRAKGLEVPGLKGRLHPAFGVYTPTRAEYVELLTRVKGVRDALVFDVGTGTGVLSFVLLQRGARQAVATDLEPRAIACATDNARRLGLAARFEAREQALFPDGRADLVVCNPPWLPEQPGTRFDAAVFDPDERFLSGFLDGLADHLTPKGRGLLIISDLAELIGLRPRGALLARIEKAGLTVLATQRTKPTHGRAKDRGDALHAVRSKEQTTLYELAPR